jgi:hypothetical protein
LGSVHSNAAKLLEGLGQCGDGILFVAVGGAQHAGGIQQEDDILAREPPVPPSKQHVNHLNWRDKSIVAQYAKRPERCFESRREVLLAGLDSSKRE